MQAPNNISQSEATIIAACMAACVSFVVGAVTVYFAYIVRNKRERNQALATLLEGISLSLQEMIDSFKTWTPPTYALCR